MRESLNLRERGSAVRSPPGPHQVISALFFRGMFISICSHLFNSPSAGLARLLSGSELRGGATRAGWRWQAGTGLSRDVSATTLPSTASFNSICFCRKTEEIMMLCRLSKPLSWLIKAWQEQELGWLSSSWRWRLGECHEGT